MPNLFGPLKDGSDVERALLEHLGEWMDTYIEQVKRVKDPAKERWKKGVASIRSYRVVHAAEENWPADQLPMLLAYSPGLAEPPYAAGDGMLNARYVCSLTAIASGMDTEDTKELARLYASAAKLAILQHETLGGAALGTSWVDERNYPVLAGQEKERTLMAVSSFYVIEVEDVLDRNAGPIEPLKKPEEDPGEWPKVKEGGGSATVEIVDELP